MAMKAPLLSVNAIQITRTMKSLLAIAVASLALVSCVPQELTGDTYSRQEVGRAQTVRTGVVESVRFVKLQGESTGGSVIGAIAGGVLGNQIGSGSGRTLGTLAGAAVGSAAGAATEQRIYNRQGIELMIKLDDGQTIVITQEHTEREPFNVGDRVRVIYGGGRTRVTH